MGALILTTGDIYPARRDELTIYNCSKSIVVDSGKKQRHTRPMYEVYSHMSERRWHHCEFLDDVRRDGALCFPLSFKEMALLKRPRLNYRWRQYPALLCR